MSRYNNYFYFSHLDASSLHPEVAEFVHDWNFVQPHFTIPSTQIQAPPNFILAQDTHQLQIAESPYGGIIEETLEQEGNCDETLAFDDSLQEEQHSSELQQMGMPPTSPRQSIEYTIEQHLFDKVWDHLSVKLDKFNDQPLPNETTTMHTTMATTTTTAIIRRKPIRPSHFSLDQDIEYGLDEAFNIRPYRPTSMMHAPLKKQTKQRSNKAVKFQIPATTTTTTNSTNNAFAPRNEIHTSGGFRQILQHSKRKQSNSTMHLPPIAKNNYSSSTSAWRPLTVPIHNNTTTILPSTLYAKHEKSAKLSLQKLTRKHEMQEKSFLQPVVQNAISKANNTEYP